MATQPAPAAQQPTPPPPASATPDDAATFPFPLPVGWPSQPHGTFNGLNIGGPPPAGDDRGQAASIQRPDIGTQAARTTAATERYTRGIYRG